MTKYVSMRSATYGSWSMTSTVPLTSLGPASEGVRTMSSVATGSVNENVEPDPSLLLTVISPPSNSMMFLQIDRPSPVPPISRVIAESTR